MEESRQPARPDRDRSRDARHHPERLYPQGREIREPPREYRVRDDPARQGPLEGPEPAEVTFSPWRLASRADLVRSEQEIVIASAAKQSTASGLRRRWIASSATPPRNNAACAATGSIRPVRPRTHR